MTTQGLSAKERFRQRVENTRSRLLDAIEAQVEQLAAKYEAPPAVPIEVRRRAFANTTRLWMFCNLSRCRRSQCCRGEPRHCLRIGHTLLPPEFLDDLLTRNKSRARRKQTLHLRQQPQGLSSSGMVLTAPLGPET